MIELNYTAQPYTFDYDLIPEGIYVAKIIGAEERTSQAGNKYISLKFQIIGGLCDRRMVFKILSLYHPKEETKKYAFKFLDGIAYALDLSHINLFGELYNRQMKVMVKLKKAIDNKNDRSDRDRNEIVRLYKMSDNPVFKPLDQLDKMPKALFAEETKPHTTDTTTPKAGDMRAENYKDDDVPF